MDYFKPQKYNLSRLRFTYDGGEYIGTGSLSWEPKEGFTVEALVARHGTPPPRSAAAKPRVLSPITVWMKPDLRQCRGAFGTCLLQLNPLQSVDDGTFQIEFTLPALTFSFHGDNSWKRRTGLSGEAIYELLRRHALWPDTVSTTVKIENRDRGTSHALAGLVIDNENAEFIGRMIDATHFEATWSLVSDGSTRSRAWRTGVAFQYALAMCFSQTVSLLKREQWIGRNWRVEMRRQHEVERLNWVIALYRMDRLDRDLIWRITLFLLEGGQRSEIAIQLFDQLVAASQARQPEASQLLLGIALEGFLRSFYNCPFSPGDRSWQLDQQLKRFRLEHFGSNASWRKRFQQASSAVRRLRNPAAHPHWLADHDSVATVTEVTNAMIFLSWFYGRLILRLAGVENPNPKPPPSLDDWPTYGVAVNSRNPE